MNVLSSGILWPVYSSKKILESGFWNYNNAISERISELARQRSVWKNGSTITIAIYK